MRVLFIINPASGASRALVRWRAFESPLRGIGLQSNQLFTAGPGHATQVAREAASDYDLLVAAGGDGTVTEVASGILATPSCRAALGILPFGTGNDLAESLGIRTQSDTLNSLTNGETKGIDVLKVICQVNGCSTVRYALLFAGVGIISEALQKTTPGLKRLFGQRLAYPAGLLRALATYRSPHMSVICDSQFFQQRFLFVGASNTAIAGGGMKIAPDAKLDDDLLNVNLIETVGRWRAVLQLCRLCRGRHTHHPQVRYLTARTLEIKSPANLEVAADGDLIGHTPASVLVQPKALRVQVPLPADRGVHAASALPFDRS